MAERFRLSLCHADLFAEHWHYPLSGRIHIRSAQTIECPWEKSGISMEEMVEIAVRFSYKTSFFP